MDKMTFSQYNPQHSNALSFSEPKLVHDPRLKVTWKSGSIWSQEVNPELVLGGYSHTVYWPNASTCIEVAKELIKRYPDYYSDPEFVLLLQYERFGVAIPKAYLDDMLSRPARFTYWVNGAWAEMYREGLTGKYRLLSTGAVQNSEEGLDQRFVMNFSAVYSPVVLADLLEAVNVRRYTLFQHGIGVYAPGKTPILHTNASAKYVTHPDLGEVPAGLQYIDFVEWDGARYEYNYEDLKVTG